MKKEMYDEAADYGTKQTPEQDIEGHGSDTSLNEEKVGGSDSKDPCSKYFNENREGGKGSSGDGLNEEVAGGKDNGVKKLY